MKSGILRVIITSSVLLQAGRAEDVHTESAWKASVFPVLEKYCTDCHDADLQKGGVDLASLAHLPDARAALRLWWRARDQLEAGQMPPPDKEQPAPEEKARLLAWIADNEAFLRSGAVQDPGEHRLRRLSRTEYSLALRDLLGVPPEPVAEMFAEEGAGGEGFDNNGDTLFIPPVLAEQYLAAADAALEAVFADESRKALLLRVAPADGRSPEHALEECVKPVLRLAFRQDISPEVLARYTGPGRRVLARGGAWEDAVRLSVKAVLCAPGFLLVSEADRPDTAVWAVSGPELATRLSLFLWSSLPDEALLTAALDGTLTDPAVLDAQVGRMIADPRGLALSRNFAGQWLQFEKVLTTVDPDRGKYKFSGDIRSALYEEAVQFCDSILRGEGRLTDFLDADYTFLNPLLAEHYGVPGVTGEGFRRVKLENSPRGGAVSLGAVLASTSLPRRTSPVLRGKWILEQLLGAPPPAPPANVGKLDDDDATAENRTVRQSLERHLRREDCRRCHMRMDPLGFALENFDPVGRWRDKLNGQPLDVTASLPDGRVMAGPAGLRQALVQDKERFVRNFCVKLLAYALGRGIEAADMPVVARMEETLRTHDYQVAPLLREVVRSLPFTHRRTMPVPIPAE